MRILVLHSDIAPDAPADELDTIYSAEEVTKALTRQGHAVQQAAFIQDPDRFGAMLAKADAEVVFNLVEGVDGLGSKAPMAIRMLDEAGAVFTGAGAVAMATTNDKPLTKRRMREAGIPTADWFTPPDWRGLRDDRTYIVKNTLEDASLGLDDGCIVKGGEAVKQRAADCAARHGGSWFAEEYIEGREFNIAVVNGRVMPMAEMVFQDWPSDQPRIVGWKAKWHEDSLESDNTVRYFGVEKDDPVLAAKLKDICEKCWTLFDLAGYARVDLRVTDKGEPFVLEINTNPGISPDAGMPAAAAQIGMDYDQFIMHLVDVARARA
jgi:D-alanine-D-alanine ligase